MVEDWLENKCIDILMHRDVCVFRLHDYLIYAPVHHLSGSYMTDDIYENGFRTDRKLRSLLGVTIRVLFFGGRVVDNQPRLG